MNAWDKMGYGLLCGLFVGAFILLGCVIFSDKKVEDYYIRSSNPVSYRIMNDISWHEDTTAFETADGEEALKVLERLKGTINE
jgi:hypothetical protein